jgi:hypothetical protein
VYRGSRKHVLDWTGRPSFLTEVTAFLANIHIPIHMPDNTIFMPRGFEAPVEARLESFGPQWHPDRAWHSLKTWWLRHPKGANTPNWDITIGCLIENRPGLILVEAKANRPELSIAGKSFLEKASANSCENHERIGAAIKEACDGWRLLDKRVAITRDSHYQLANRLAFTWKLAMLGFPVILLYLGFTGDEDIRDVGEPFADEEDWQAAFNKYSSGTIPFDLFNRRLQIGPSPVWLISKSRPII